MNLAHWLAVIVCFTATTWLPYVNERAYMQGLWAALDNPRDDAAPPAAWAARSKRAHANAIENLALFGPLAAVAQAAGLGDNPHAILAAEIYLVARVTHYVVYTAGIPVIRTLGFFSGWLATLYLGWLIIGS